MLSGIFLLIAFFFFPIVLFVLLRWLLRHYGLAALMPMKDVIPSVRIGIQNAGIIHKVLRSVLARYNEVSFHP